MSEHDDKYYQDFVFSDKAKRGMPASIKARQQENLAKNKKNVFDEDIILWVSQQNNATQKHFNNVLREMIALQQAVR
ncbi:MAG: hypothetical protein KGV51_03520 [Moraxellaceae bacterium]|nr:hypothetical protein [Moraxellaceae bacterium]